MVEDRSKRWLQRRRATELRLQANGIQDETRSMEVMQCKRRRNVGEDRVVVAVGLKLPYLQWR